MYCRWKIGVRNYLIGFICVQAVPTFAFFPQKRKKKKTLRRVNSNLNQKKSKNTIRPIGSGTFFGDNILHNNNVLRAKF